VPREVKKSKNRTRLTLAAILQPAGINGAEIVASLHKRKKRFKYSRQLRRFISDNNLERSFFKPLEKYLVKQIRAGQNNVQLPLNTLLTFLQSGQGAKYNVDVALDKSKNFR
jgi:hypothetical protein